MAFPKVASGAMPLISPDPGLVRQTIEAGGVIRFSFDGTVMLQDHLVIATNTVIDATDHTVYLDGGGAARHFLVTNGASLRLIDVTLTNGLSAGADAQASHGSMPGIGGSIYTPPWTSEAFTGRRGWPVASEPSNWLRN